jgi:predicted metal-dependent hydrolase
VIPALPLRLRNRLAETIRAALRDTTARRALATLAADGGREWLERHEVHWAAPLAARARVACAAVADRPLLGPDADLRETLAAAAALFDAGLYFEVHEVLEPRWGAASGQEREALQGLIQVAVAWQHHANGNLAGACSLLVEGGARLHGRRLAGADLEPLARAATQAAEHLAAGQPITAPLFPPLAKEAAWTSS